MSKLIITGQLTLTGGQLTSKETPAAAPAAGKELWAWGLNTSNGYVGDGTAIARSSPVQIGALTDWTSVSTNSDTGWSLSRKTDGTIWSWGSNSYGRLGDGTVVAKNSPIQIGALTDWASINAGYWSANAVKTDGSLWTWGRGQYGRLGLGNLTNYSSPVQVGALTDWSVMNGGQHHILAIKTDGTLWVWGNNGDGRLGLGSGLVSGSKSSPVQVGALSDWASISGGNQHSLAVKTDGSLWAWGTNSTAYPVLGDGTVIAKSSPIQIGSLTDWASVSAGGGKSHAIKTDGSLWSWGRGVGGRLALGNTTSYSSPVQVGALLDWSTVDGAGSERGAAFKTDGTIWTWGSGGSGVLGHGNTTNYSSPVQVGSTTTWTSIEASLNHMVATKNAS